MSTTIIAAPRVHLDPLAPRRGVVATVVAAPPPRSSPQRVAPPGQPRHRRCADPRARVRQPDRLLLLIGLVIARVLARTARRPRRTFVRTTVVLTVLSLVHGRDRGRGPGHEGAPDADAPRRRRDRHHGRSPADSPESPARVQHRATTGGRGPARGRGAGRRLVTRASGTCPRRTGARSWLSPAADRHQRGETRAPPTRPRPSPSSNCGAVAVPRRTGLARCARRPPAARRRGCRPARWIRTSSTGSRPMGSTRRRAPDGGRRGPCGCAACVVTRGRHARPAGRCSATACRDRSPAAAAAASGQRQPPRASDVEWPQCQKSLKPMTRFTAILTTRSARVTGSRSDGTGIETGPPPEAFLVFREVVRPARIAEVVGAAPPRRRLRGP